MDSPEEDTQAAGMRLWDTLPVDSLSMQPTDQKVRNPSINYPRSTKKKNQQNKTHKKPIKIIERTLSRRNTDGWLLIVITHDFVLFCFVLWVGKIGFD